MKKLIENIIPYIIVFTASIYRPYDSDLGWHLKYGEYFFKNGHILKDNIFSTMMTDYKWANLSWATDILTYIVFNNFSFFGLTILGALIITLTFYFFSKTFNLNYFEKALIFPLLILIESTVNQVSFRSQLLSVLFIGILFYILKKYEKNISKIIFTIPLLFLLWANVHGQFILGLFLYSIWSILYIINIYYDVRNLKKVVREITILGTVFISSLIATIINPFGFKLYEEIFLYSSGSELRKIAEYLPFEEQSFSWWSQVIIGILIFLGTLFMYLENKFKKNIQYLGTVISFYFLAWIIKRYAWSMYYISIPFLKPLASFLKPESKKITFYISTVLFLIYLSVAIYSKSPFNQYTNMSWDVYCKEYAKCSAASVEYLIKNNLDNDLLTLYNWGGFIIWNYPQIKPSIDGRMHLWKSNKGYSAFADYYGYEQNLKDINESKYKVVLMSPEKPVYKRLLKLTKEEKWRMVYQDNYSGIFVRQNFVNQSNTN